MEAAVIMESGRIGLHGSSRMRTGTKCEEDVLNGNVLMVDQLWLWTINTGKLCWALLLLQQTNFV